MHNAMFGDDGASEEEGGLALVTYLCAFHSISLLGKTGFIF